MSTSESGYPNRFSEAISRRQLSIYDPIEVGDPEVWIPSRDLEILLDNGLRGISLAGLPLRTRSKVVKTRICEVLGYPSPKSFKKTKPRFPGQQFDTYIQKADNLQVWNEELVPSRRYVFVRVGTDGRISRVKVVAGDRLGELATTGTLTQKYQARCVAGAPRTELLTPEDTDRLKPLVSRTAKLSNTTPITYPKTGELLSVASVFDRLTRLVGHAFNDVGYDQERNRGAVLHRQVCQSLGYRSYQDDGRFPDVRHQLLEVKLQTSPTIDLGLVRPDSTDVLDVPKISGRQVRHCDVRYAIFCGDTKTQRVTLTHLFVTTGAGFFRHFPQFQGRILNRKLQIRLPHDFFSI